MTIIYLYVFIFGAIIGSFLNCLIWRLHKSESIMGRSYCPKCKGKIIWYDNIPILSYLFLRGKCRKCHKRIAVQYPLIELVAGILFLVAFFMNYKSRVLGITNYELFDSQFVIQLLRDWFLICIMIIIFIYDLRWYMILDIVTIPACLIIFILNLFIGISWLNLLISGIIGGSFFLIQFLVSGGKWIGGGDIRLGLLIGLALGWPNVLLAVFLAYIIGSFVGVGLIVFGQKKWSSKLPLGTFLSLSSIIILFFGQYLINLLNFNY